MNARVLAGLANIDGICDPLKRVAIAHERGQYSSAQTVTHELGHKSVSVLVRVILLLLSRLL